MSKSGRKPALSGVTHCHELSGRLVSLQILGISDDELANSPASNALQDMSLLLKGFPDTRGNFKVVADHGCPILVVDNIWYQLDKNKKYEAKICIRLQVF